MLDFARAIGQLLFTLLYAVVMVITAVFVLPFVWIRDHLHVLVAIGAVTTALALSGCTISVDKTLNSATQRLESSVSRSQEVIDRSLEFAQGAPEAPYEPLGSAEAYQTFAEDNDLLLTGQQLARIAGAAKLTTTDPALVATILEQEQRWLDDGELERDILSALTGENSSVGLGQVRVSTAQEIEREDPFGVFMFTGEQTSDEARTDLVRRLANDDWNILYASTYVYLLQNRHLYDGPLGLAQRYVGASPQDPQVGDQEELFSLFEDLFE